MSTLMDELGRLDQKAVCLVKSGREMPVSEVLAGAVSLRREMAALQGRSVALCGLPAESLIEALVAFDGFAGEIFLMPAGGDEKVQQRLVEQARCAYTLGCDQALAPAGGGREGGLKGAPTRWTLATSGTTGVPKLISHTFSSLTRRMKRDAGRGARYTWGLMYDPSRFAGLQVVLQSLVGGARLVLPVVASFEGQVAALLEQKVNALSATPSLWRKMLMDGRIAALQIRQITLGGEIVDQPLLDALRKLFPDSRIVHIYASTEAGAAFAVQDGRAGFPSSWLDNPEAPVPLKIGRDGQLLIKPAEPPTGAEISSRLDADGFLDTQDLVKQDGDRVYFMGRVSGAINVGGNKVHPEEVENIIREVPGVLDVRIYPKQSSIMGQLVASEIVPSAEVDGKVLRQMIQTHCRTKLQPWQCPSVVTLVSHLNETAAGKRDRRNG